MKITPSPAWREVQMLVSVWHSVTPVATEEASMEKLLQRRIEKERRPPHVSDRNKIVGIT
ncbi:MAG: hypothetical protein WDM78_11315 [Puia sp.]